LEASGVRKRKVVGFRGRTEMGKGRKARGRSEGGEGEKMWMEGGGE